MKEYFPIPHKKTYDFIDRTEIREYIIEILKHKIQKENYFEVISLYGMGGIGKTCLIEEIKTEARKELSKNRIIHVTFEIQQNRQFIENLVKISMKYNGPCILFNYALLKYNSLVDIYQLDNNILQSIQKNFIPNFIDCISQSTNYVLNLKAINLPSLNIPSINDILDAIDTIYVYTKRLPYHKEINTIKELNSKELLYNLPIYLGLDIRNSEIGNKEKMIFLFDSYVPSKPYSESSEWLARFIGSLQMGLCIVASREKILWEDITPHELRCYPEDETKKYLCKYIHNNDLVDAIIKSTECVPIYVDLALNVYMQELNYGISGRIDSSMFKDRESLVMQFINHLKPEWQEVILNLATIRVFNRKIFEHIVSSRHLPCSFNDYDEIINVSLVNYVENTNSLVKLHDVFCKNVIKILPSNNIFFNVESYLDYVLKRELYDNYLSANISLLINIINVEKDFLNIQSIPIRIIEKTLDIYFMIYNTGVTFQIVLPDEKCSKKLKDMLYFMAAVSEKKKSTPLSLQYMDKIENKNNLGYHKKSYEILKLYANSLQGDYNQLSSGLEELNQNMNETEQIFWYYAQTKLYTTDLKTLYGEFLDSLNDLVLLKNSLDNSIYSLHDKMQIYRIEGHIYRFNYYFEKAFESYSSVLENTNSLSTKAYIYTNIIETVCYFDSDYVNAIFDEALMLVKKDGQTRNEAKLYYAKAISDILNYDYVSSEKNINQSIQINTADNYQSGLLFSYMANAYLDYAKTKKISDEIQRKINVLLEENEVYVFFKLPLSIMQGHLDVIRQIENEFQWLDFRFTYKRCLDFIKKLGI